MIDDYLRMGMALVAIPAHAKGPRTPGWQESKCTDLGKLQAGNVGLNHALTGTCCLDVDDAVKFRAWWTAQGFPPEALRALLGAVPVWTSGRPNRYKALFRAPAGMRTLALHAHGFELRAAGGQDVLPPSVVVDDAGNEWQYHWVQPVKDLESLAMLPAKLLAAAQGTPRDAAQQIAPSTLMAAMLDVVPEGGRNDYISRVAYAKIKNGVSGEELLREVMEVNEAKCTPPLDEDEVRAILRGKERARVEPAPEAIAASAYGIFMPHGYRVHAGALQMLAKGDDDEADADWQTMLPYVVAVTNVIRVPGVQEQRYIEITVLNPHEAKHPVTMQQLGKEFEIALNNIGVSVTGKRAQQLKAFLIASKEKLEREQKVTDSYKQFGWQPDRSFLIGNRLYKRGEQPRYVHLESHAASLARFMPLQGSPHVWARALDPIFAKGNERQAYAFVQSLAAVLMHLSGERGGVFSMVGPSGQGKSTVQAAVASVFGSVESAFSKAQDTENARIAFLSIMHNLPVQAEELTKLGPEKLAVLAYDVSEGRDKRRLDRSGGMREMAPEWHTILTSSSNAPIVEQLLDKGHVAEAYRVLEMRVVLPPGAKLQEGDAMKREFLANVGAAGHVLAQYLTEHYERVESSLHKVTERLQQEARATTEERIRVNMVAAATVMAAILRKALAVDVDHNAIYGYGRNLIFAARDHKRSFDNSALDVLTGFINENTMHCIQTNRENVVAMLVHTVAPYIMRYEAANKLLFISSKDLRRFVLACRMDWSDFQKELSILGVLKCVRRITISKGAVGIPPQGQLPCLELDATKLDVEFEAEQEKAA